MTRNGSFDEVNMGGFSVIRLLQFAICLHICISLNACEIFEPEVKQIVPFLNQDARRGTEGPMFDINGDFFVSAFYQVVQDGALIYRIDEDNREVQLFATPKKGKYFGLPTGGEFDKDGQLWVTDMRLGLLKVQPDGKFKQVVKRDLARNRLQGMNDAVFDYHGKLWTSAPAGEIAPAEYTDAFSDNRTVGSIYCYIPAENSILKVDTDLGFTNGIAVQHSVEGVPQTLLVADSSADVITAYDIEGSCKVTNKRVWGIMQDSVYDGMEFDSKGNLLVANFGKGFIDVFGANGGAPHTRIKMPFSRVTNLAFKPSSTLVYVTEVDTAGVWEFKWKNTGMKKYFEL